MAKKSNPLDAFNQWVTGITNHPIVQNASSFGRGMAGGFYRGLDDVNELQRRIMPETEKSAYEQQYQDTFGKPSNQAWYDLGSAFSPAPKWLDTVGNVSTVADAAKNFVQPQPQYQFVPMQDMVAMQGAAPPSESAGFFGPDGTYNTGVAPYGTSYYDLPQDQGGWLVDKSAPGSYINSRGELIGPVDRSPPVLMNGGTAPGFVTAGPEGPPGGYSYWQPPQTLESMPGFYGGGNTATAYGYGPEADSYPQFPGYTGPGGYSGPGSWGYSQPGYGLPANAIANQYRDVPMYYPGANNPGLGPGGSNYVTSDTYG